MNKNLSHIYTEHHANNREKGFSIMKDERSLLLKELIGSGKKVLDIGCRDGALTKCFVDGNYVLGIDIDDNALAEAKRSLGIETMNIDLNGDWQELGDRKFDVIVAGEVLEHLYYPDLVALKVKNHLEAGGVFVGSVPNAFSYKNRLRYLKGQKKYTPLSDPTHINQFSYRELKWVLEKYFKNVEIVGLGRYSRLSRLFPNAIAFDLFFKVTK